MKKVLKMLIAFLVIMAQAIILMNNVNAANIGEIKDLERGEKGYYCVQKWDGKKWIYLTYNQTFYTDSDGQRYMAYCLCPGLPGVGYVSGEKETYQVKINEQLDNDVIWRVLKNGYPNKSIEELGLETADDAYFATMQAINAILRGYTLEQAQELYSPGKFAINGENIEDIQRRGEKTLNAMYNLINIGLNGTESRKQFLNISIKKQSEFQEENSEFYSQVFAIDSSAEISNYSIDKIEGLPEGSYIVDANGNKKEVFNNSESFKVLIPKNCKDNEISGNIKIKVLQKNYPVYYGASLIEGYQDYALCNKSYGENVAEVSVNAKLDKSELVIKKIDSENKNGLKGVKFKIITSDGETNEYETDDEGKIIISNQKPGTIIIKETKPIGKYQINENEVKVDLKYNEKREVVIENELQKGKIKIIKTDKNNNEIKLENVKFELRDENDKVIREGKTDKNGELIFDNLVIGKYKLVETETNSEYKLQDEEVIVEVLNNKVQEVNIQNEKDEIPEEQKKEKVDESNDESIEEYEEKQTYVEENIIINDKKLPKTGEDFVLNDMIKNTLLFNMFNSIFLIRVFRKK